MDTIERILRSSLERRLELWYDVEKSISALINDLKTEMPEGTYGDGVIYVEKINYDNCRVFNVIERLADIRDRQLKSLVKEVEYPEKIELIRHKAEKEIKEAWKVEVES